MAQSEPRRQIFFFSLCYWIWLDTKLELLCSWSIEEESVSTNRTNTEVELRDRERETWSRWHVREARSSLLWRQPAPGLFRGMSWQKPFSLWPVWMEFSVPYTWRSPNYDIRQWVELFSLESTDNKLHKLPPLKAELPEVGRCVISGGRDNRHSGKIKILF